MPAATQADMNPCPDVALGLIINDDNEAMQHALSWAQRAAEHGEVPVGAVVVRDGRIIGVGHNAPIACQDPTAHAEIIALRAAARHLHNYRLDDCTLYVTLEPCAMCVGAILSARVGRVVFGAFDAKAGAAGSVVDLFSDARLNHQTQVVGGVLADASRFLLQSFFRARRSNPAPLRDDTLRTPEQAFADLHDYPWQPNYISDLPALRGLRLHYLDEGPTQAPQTWLCLHGCPTWSYLYRHIVQPLLDAGQRVVVPDLPGFGKSDKPKKERAHDRRWHLEVISELVEHLDLHHIVLIGHQRGNLLVAELPPTAPQRYSAAVFIGSAATAPADKTCRTINQFIQHNAGVLAAVAQAAYAAPFPDHGHQAAIRASCATAPILDEETRAFWQTAWSGKTLACQWGTDRRAGPAVNVIHPTAAVEIAVAAATQPVCHEPEPSLAIQALDHVRHG